MYVVLHERLFHLAETPRSIGCTNVFVRKSGNVIV